MMNVVLLMMGGSGTRFGANIPKQYVLVNDRPVFSYILEKYNRLSCVDICRHTVKLHRIAFESLYIKIIKLCRQSVITEFRTIIIPCQQKRSHASETRILCKTLVVTDHASDLTAFVVAAETRPSRNSDQTVESDEVFHQNVENARSKKPAHGAPFKYKPVFHSGFLIDSPFFKACIYRSRT